MTRRRYPADLTDGRWQLLAPLIPLPKPGGRPRSVDVREVVNAVLYVDRTGVTRRGLPHDFPPGKTGSHDFRAWRLDGTWERVHDALRAQVRRRAGREPSPSAAILDSRSVKTTDKGGRAATTPARR